jgi:hypothetical protein
MCANFEYNLIFQLENLKFHIENFRMEIEGKKPCIYVLVNILACFL